MSIRLKPGHFCVIAFLCVFILSCTSPTPDVAIAKMEKYWGYYKVENYDSLRTFYRLKGNPNEGLNAIIGTIQNLHENYGDVQNVHLSVKEIANDGNWIRLVYEVKFDKKSISNIFTFKKNKYGEFNITDHKFGQY